MKTLIRALAVLALAAIVLVPTGAVLAQGLNQGEVVFGSTFVLERGETLYGDLVIFGGMAVIEEGATVQGTAVLVGGTMDVQGEITEDVALIGGTLELGETAVIHGDLSVVGGVINRAPGATIEGQVTTNAPVPDLPVTPITPQIPDLGHENLGLQLVNVVVRAVIVGALAMLAMLFLAPQAGRVSAAITGQPFVTGAMGLLAILMTPVAMVMMIITLVLIPLALLVPLLLALLWLFGIISLGYVIGERFTALLRWRWAAPLSAGFGTFLLLVVIGGFGLIDCIGWVGWFLATILGVGGLVTTSFGTRAVIPPAAPAASAPPTHPTPPQAAHPPADPLPPAS